MKLEAVVFGLCLGSMFLGVANADAPGESSVRTEIQVKALLAPPFGYEEKNNVQVVLYGYLPNQCYTLSDNTVDVLPDGHVIVVRQFAVHDTSGVCVDESTMPDHMKMAVPFTSEVSVGHLNAGGYRFVFNGSDPGPHYRIVDVQKNVTMSVDTLPYAAVSQVSAQDTINGVDPVKVKISGLLNSTCTSLNQDVKVIYENDVFVLLPTITVKHGVICAQIMVPFEKEVDLGATVPGVHLIHVRSMNGKAVNKVVVVAK